MPSGSSLTIGTNVNIALVANETANVSGDFLINTGSNYNTGAAGAFTSVFGTITNQGTLTGDLNTITFQSGGSYVHNQDGGTIPTATWM
ncbi:MAG: hypothetical protein WDM90_18565 [Ferruginibacter sp.]